MINEAILSAAENFLPRKIEHDIRKALIKKGIIILLGSRQVGKTSIMYRLIHYLLNKKEKDVPPSQIIYIDLEFPRVLSEIDGLYGDEFINWLRAKGVNTDDDSFIFIDEIHYLKNPSSFLKTLHDHYPGLKLIVSGSSSLMIKHKFKDTLAGRKQVFEINPLDFEEFLTFKDSPLAERKKQIDLRTIIENKKLPDMKELKYLIPEFTTNFDEFAVFGGYPGVVLKQPVEDKIYLLADIYSSYIRKDIKDFAQINNVSAFNRLIELLTYQIGGMVNLSELTNSLNISRQTIENYLFLLENTYVLSLLPPYYTNRRKEIVKSPKVFFHDNGIRNSIVRNFDTLDKRMDKGALFENAVFSELHKHINVLETLHFHRTKTKIEVDFVIKSKNIIPIEVKYRPFKKTIIPSGLRSFIKDYNPETAYVVTKDFFGETVFENTDVLFIPGWVL